MPAAPRTVRTFLLVVLAAGVLGAVVISWSMLNGMMRPPRSESTTQLSDATTTAVEIVVEVKAFDGRDTISGLLLAPGTAEASYLRTRTSVRVTMARSVRFVMGSKADLVNGAVIDVRGARQPVSPLTVLADRVVVLSGNVTVQ